MHTAEKMPNQRVEHDGKSIVFQVQVFLIPEGEQVVAFCPALNLSTYGENEEDAKVAFGEALDIFVEDTQEKGTLDKILLDLGWTLTKRPTPKYDPPQPSTAFLNSIGTGNRHVSTVNQPMQLAFA